MFHFIKHYKLLYFSHSFIQQTVSPAGSRADFSLLTEIMDSKNDSLCTLCMSAANMMLVSQCHSVTKQAMEIADVLLI